MLHSVTLFLFRKRYDQPSDINGLARYLVNFFRATLKKSKNILPMLNINQHPSLTPSQPILQICPERAKKKHVKAFTS